MTSVELQSSRPSCRHTHSSWDSLGRGGTRLRSVSLPFRFLKTKQINSSCKAKESKNGGEGGEGVDSLRSLSQSLTHESILSGSSDTERRVRTKLRGHARAVRTSMAE